MVKRVGHPEANPKIKVPAIKAGASRNREALRGRLHDEHLASTHTHIILIRSLYRDAPALRGRQDDEHLASTVDFEQGSIES